MAAVRWVVVLVVKDKLFEKGCVVGSFGLCGSFGFVRSDKGTHPLSCSLSPTSVRAPKLPSLGSTSGSLVQRFEQFLTRKQIEDQIKLWEDSCHSLLHPKTDSDKVGSSTH